MKQLKVLIIVGSLREHSLNRKMANALEKLAPAEFILSQLNIAELPHYNQDDDDTPAPAVVRLKSEISAADGLIFVTPEYNRSIPGVLKNALDHASRPYGKNVWAKKTAGILGVSIGMTGTAMAQQHLRNILSYLDVSVLAQPEAYFHDKNDLFDAQGNLNELTRPFLQTWMDHYATLLKAHAMQHTT